jgi:hypothetical protein
MQAAKQSTKVLGNLNSMAWGGKPTKSNLTTLKPKSSSSATKLSSQSEEKTSNPWSASSNNYFSPISDSQKLSWDLYDSSGSNPTVSKSSEGERSKNKKEPVIDYFDFTD